MASTAIPLLSSSPPRPFRTFEMPSSPSFPPSTGFSPKRIPILRTGSRATPIPQSAFASFTTAASLLRRTSIDNACGFGIELSFENDAIEQSSILQKRDTPFENGMGTLSANNDDCGVGEVVEAVRKKLVTDGDGGKKRTRKPQTRNARPEEGAFPEQRPLLEPQSKKALVDVHEDRNIRRRSAPKSRVKETDLEVSKDAITKSTAPRKPPLKASSGGSALEDGKRKRKTIARPREKELEIQTKITKSKITKPSIVGRSEKDQGLGSTKQPEIMSRHFTSTSHKIQTPLDIGLIPAIRRRVTWTPPPAANDSILVDTPVAEIGGHKIECSTVDQVIENNGKVFTTLLANFGFSSDSSNAPRGIRSGTATKKRKQIELVRTASSTSEGLSTLNTKVNKKKARTLTEIATSAYARDEDTPGTAAPLLEYFEMQKVDPKTRNCFNDPPMPRAKSPVKKTIKGTKQAPILLSPESALEQVSKQEFVFGTSSQLAREESPSFLRDIHAAMQASNVVEESDVSWGDSLEPTSTILPNKSLGKSTLIAKQGLWSAAARDVSGELLDVEIVDLVESPIIKILRDELLVQKEYPLVANITSQQNSNHLLVNKLPLQDGTRPIGPVEAAIRNELLSSPSGTKVNVARTKSPAKISKQSKSPTTTEKTVDRPFQQKNCPESKMPTFSAYTTSQLNKRISDYRFKPIKSREKMINILERCWEGEQRLALKSLGSNTIVGSSRPKKSGIAKKKARASEETELPSPKRSRGRPKKDNTAILSPRSNSNGINTFENLDMGSDTPLSQIRTPKKHKTKIAQPFEDISDSDTQLAPSPPRRRPSQVCTSPLPIKPFAATAEDVTAPDHLQILLFKHITQAITALSPSKDFKIPCWHEKILLYDPIILEDFTVWLNTGALEKAGWDGEVEPKEVKKWCESKSICCLWKENLRGGVRSRYS